MSKQAEEYRKRLSKSNWGVRHIEEKLTKDDLVVLDRLNEAYHQEQLKKIIIEVDEDVNRKQFHKSVGGYMEYLVAWKKNILEQLNK